MKLLLAGPGTGKTTKIQTLIDDFSKIDKILIMSFTNATVNDLLKDLSAKGVTGNNCMTLHKFAIKYNHDNSRHVLLPEEEKILNNIAKRINLEFDALCDQLNATTFNQMIDRFILFAKSNEIYLKEKLENFKYLIVDEYQDFNPHEQALIDLLLGYFNETILLGDDDQCIYDFKDASSEKLIEFHNDSDVEKLDHEHMCHRCPDKVVEHATNLIKNNKKRVDKPWHKSGKKGVFVYLQKENLDAMADYVIRNIKNITKKDPDASILILAPVKFISEPVAQKLVEENTDFENANAIKIDPAILEKTWEVRSLFGNFKYLNLLFLGYAILSQRNPFYALLKRHLESGQDFDELFEKVSKKLPEEVKLEYKNIEIMLELDRYREVKDMYDQTEGEVADDKLERIFQIKKDLPIKKIKVMSIHKSKGLGEDYVFVLGLTDGILPNQKAGIDSIESQRRLFYVAMTRAKKCLCVISILKIPGKYARKMNIEKFTFDKYKKLWHGKASIFVSELKL